MYLTTQEIEDIGAGVLADFRTTTGINTLFTPIDQLATEYLGMQVKFAKFSASSKVYGLTVYTDTNYTVEIDGQRCIYPMHANEIFLDTSFIEPQENVHKLCGMRRFTLAHECAHQILFRLEPDTMKSLHRQKYSTRKAYSCRDLKTREDWNEWQANALGATLLMPAGSIQELLQTYRIISYAGRLSGRDTDLMDMMCSLFKVSHSAMRIRLENLGFLKSAESMKNTSQQVLGGVEIG